MPTIPCEQIVYRAMRKKSWVKNGRIDPYAFFLRYDATPPEGGLSVGLDIESAIGTLSNVTSAASLHVGRLRDLGLDVAQDPIPGNPKHCVIIGLPRADAPADEKEYVAGQLAELARLHLLR